MNEWLLALILVGAAGVVVYGCYHGGYMTINTKHELLFIGALSGRRARFAACTGSTRRIVRFPESRVYHFSFATDLSDGTVEAKLIEPGGKPVVHMVGAGEADAQMDASLRYAMVFRFEQASGTYTLDWQ